MSGESLWVNYCYMTSQMPCETGTTISSKTEIIFYNHSFIMSFKVTSIASIVHKTVNRRLFDSQI